MRLVIITLLTGISFISRAQQQLLIKVISEKDNMPVAASILLKGTTKGYSTDSTGAASITFVRWVQSFGFIAALKVISKLIQDQPTFCQMTNTSQINFLNLYNGSAYKLLIAIWTLESTAN